MTSITATPNDATGAVALEITKTSAVSKVVRTNVNGSEEVRASTGQLPSTYVAAEGSRNYITNPSFETGTTGWTANSGTPTLTSDGAFAMFGTKSMKMVSTTTATDIAVYPSPSVALTAGTTYTLSWYVYSPDARTASFDVSGLANGFGTTAIPANAWTRVAGTFTAATTASPTIYLHHKNGPVGPGPVVYIDGVLLEASANVGTYFDGSTAPDVYGSYSWLSTPYASASIRTTGGTLILTDYEASFGLNSYNAYVDDYFTRTNYCINPRAVTATGWGYQLGTSEAATQTLETGAGPNGLNGFIRRATTTAKTAGNSGFYRNETIAGVTGDSFTSSVWVRSSIAITVQLNVSTRTGSTSVTLGTGASVTLVANMWTRLSTTVTSTGTFDNVQSWALLNSAQILGAGATFDATQMLTEQGVDLKPFFDGATPDITDVDYAWTGTANGSNSTEATHVQQVTASATLNIENPWLSVPVMPQYSETVQTITQFGAGREANTTVHRPLGRADSLVVMGKLGDRTGSLEIFCNTYADARTLERVFERGEVIQLRQRIEGMDMYFTATSIPVSPYSVAGESGTKWAMTINYVEVRRPIGDLAGALGWTFDELASSFASFNAVTPAFTNFDSLTLGDGIV